MKKKILVIAGSVAGVLVVAVAVGYIFFWEDVQLLLGGAPKSADMSAKGGGVDLVAEFSAAEPGSKGTPQPASAPADDPGHEAEAEVAKPVDVVNVEEPSAPPAEGGVDLGGEDEPAAEGEEAPEEGEEKAAAPPARKSEPVPTLSRKSEPPASVPPSQPKTAPPVKSVTVAPPSPARPPSPPNPPRPVALAPVEISASTAVQKKAQALIQRRKYPEAESILNQHLASHPSDGDARFMMGFLQVQQNRKGIAIMHFQKAAQDAKDPQIRQMAEQYLKKLR